MDVPENGGTSKALTEEDLNANLDDYPTKNPWITLPDVEEFMNLPAATNVSMADVAKIRAISIQPKPRPSW